MAQTIVDVVNSDLISDTETRRVSQVAADDPGLGAEIFWTPKFVRPTAYIEHIPVLFWLVSELRPDHAVTLGLGGGTAHFALCQAVKFLGLATVCRGIDVAERGADSAATLLFRYNEAHYSDFSQVLSSDLSSSARDIKERSIDLLIVDSPLTVALLDALELAWLPCLSERGVLVLGDTETLPAGDPRRDRIERMSGDGTVYELRYGRGLMVLTFGPPGPVRLEETLADASDGARESALGLAFRRMGALLRHEMAGQVRAAPAAQKEPDTVYLRQALARSEAVRKTVTQELDEARRAAGEAEAALADLRSRDGSSTTDDRAAQIEAMVERDRRLVEMADEIDALRRDNTDLTSEMRARFDEIALLTRLLEANEQKLAETAAADRELREKDNRIAELGAVVTELQQANAALEQGRTELHQELDRLMAERAALADQVEAMTGSKSWKMTAPVRMVGKIVQPKK